jgi:hypothetical protein
MPVSLEARVPLLARRVIEFGIPRYYSRDLRGGRAIQEHVLRTLYLGVARRTSEQGVPAHHETGRSDANG